MDKGMSCIGWLIAAAILVSGCAADTYTVGNGMGWTIPPGGEVAYTTWAAGIDFDLGDTITFNWRGTHNVVEVTKAGYDNCSATNNMGLGPIQSNSPYSFILNSTAPHYFICTVGDHCRLGQKLTIQAGAESPSDDLPPSSAAHSLTTAAAALSAFFLATATLLI